MQAKWRSCKQNLVITDHNCHDGDVWNLAGPKGPKGLQQREEVPIPHRIHTHTYIPLGETLHAKRRKCTKVGRIWKNAITQKKYENLSVSLRSQNLSTAKAPASTASSRTLKVLQKASEREKRLESSQRGPNNLIRNDTSSCCKTSGLELVKPCLLTFHDFSYCSTVLWWVLWRTAQIFPRPVGCTSPGCKIRVCHQTHPFGWESWHI